VLADQAGHTYLKNAIELVGIGSGNANGLCESGERCLYTPNFGSYQGHGELGTCRFTDGKVKGVTMYGYSKNGY
jgi:hypothetical protein